MSIRRIISIYFFSFLLNPSLDNAITLQFNECFVANLVKIGKVVFLNTVLLINSLGLGQGKALHWIKHESTFTKDLLAKAFLGKFLKRL